LDKSSEQYVKTSQPHRIAIVGSGPRGLSVLERLAARIAEAGTNRRVDIYLIDPIQVGCGRIWRTDQPNWFVMNTVADEVSAFSGPPDGGPTRPGAGPSLAQWWSDNDPDYPGLNSYAPRALHGHYMQFVLTSIESTLNADTKLHKIMDSVIDLKQAGDNYQLTLSSGATIKADRVIIVTGHAIPELEGKHRYLADFAAMQPGLRYIRGDSSADMPLANIGSGSPVGILGLGLSFYDVMAALTIGRGGRFVDQPDGTLQYQSSGREPVLFAGSRSGMLIPARGQNQKHADYRYDPLIFTIARAKELRQKGQINFRDDVVPFLLAEVNLVYYETAIRQRRGTSSATRFRCEIARLKINSAPVIAELASSYDLGDFPQIDLDRIAHPFADLFFSGPHAFTIAVLDALRVDFDNAVAGNVDSPLKAALDVIRDIRPIIRYLVDFSGLTPASYKTDFLGWYVPRSSFLSAGPPRYRIQQTIALIKAGLLRIVGPNMDITCDVARRCFVMSSPRVEHSSVDVTTVIDARVPIPNVALDQAPLTQKLVERGFWTNYLNCGATDSFVTGGVAVTPAPFHPIGQHQIPNRQLYVLGIPIEHTRWFMQAGSSRPGFWTDFVMDADSIAADALLPTRVQSPALHQDQQGIEVPSKENLMTMLR